MQDHFLEEVVVKPPVGGSKRIHSPWRPPEHEYVRIARLRVIARCAAVHEALQDRHAIDHDLVACLSREVRHHPHAARVVFVFAAVEALALLGRTVVVVYSLHI